MISRKAFFLLALALGVLGWRLLVWRRHAELRASVSCVSVRECVDLGYAAYGRKDLRQAYRAFQKAVELSPLNEEAYLGMARVFENQPNKKEVIRILSAFLQEHPEAHGARACRGYLHDVMGDRSPALEDYSRALAGSLATQLFVREQRGLYFARERRLRDAIQDFKWCRRNASEQWKFPYLLGCAWEDAGEEHEAVVQYRAALALMPREEWQRDALAHYILRIQAGRGVISLSKFLKDCCGGFSGEAEPPPGNGPARLPPPGFPQH